MKVVTKKIEEKILLKENASQIAGMKFVDGQLFLTHKRLYFNSNSEVSKNLDLETIVKVNSFSCLGLITNGLKIKLNNGGFEIFFVNNKFKWIESINKQTSQK